MQEIINVLCIMVGIAVPLTGVVWLHNFDVPCSYAWANWKAKITRSRDLKDPMLRDALNWIENEDATVFNSSSLVVHHIAGYRNIEIQCYMWLGMCKIVFYREGSLTPTREVKMKRSWVYPIHKAIVKRYEKGATE